MIHTFLFASLLAQDPSATEAPANGELETKVAGLFEDACAICHDSSDELNMEVAPAELVGLNSVSNGKPLIKPGDPNGSYLYLKMLGAEGIDGDPMPLGEDPLPEEDMAAVRDWIAGLAAAAPAAATGEVPPDGTDPPSDGEAVTPAATATVTTSPPPKLQPRKGKKPFHGTHQIALHTNTTLGKRNLEFRVHHRFGLWGKPFRPDKGSPSSYFGLSGGVVMSLGMAYGIIDGLDVQTRFSNGPLGHELGLKYVPVRQEEGMPVSFGLYGSGEFLSQPDLANRYTGNLHVMVSRLWFERWSTQLTVGYSALTNKRERPVIEIDGEQIVTNDRRGTLNLGLASTVWLGKRKRHGIDLEYILPVPAPGEPDLFYYNGGDGNPDGSIVGSWSLGWSVKAGLHFFQVFVTNTRNIHTNAVAPGSTTNENSPIGSDGAGNFYVGFNLSRIWSL